MTETQRIVRILRRRQDGLRVHLRGEAARRCQCYWCGLWAPREALSDLEAVLGPEAVEVIGRASVEEMEEVARWATEQLKEL